LKAYYGDRFSPNMTRTPEGYLICHNVPIARTGVQDYMENEIGGTGSNIVHVYRRPEDIFKPSAIASFEGKPVTDNHPPTNLDTSSIAAYMKGIAQNVRRGSGEESNKLLGDLIVYDPNLIAEIDAGKREISCGYNCDYIPNEDGTYDQKNIIGNHVAIVPQGRAGHSVTIKDEKPNPPPRKEKNMKDESILHKMFSAFVKDAEPEEALKAAQAINDCDGGEHSTKDEEPNDPMKEMAAQIAELTKKVDALAAAEQKEAEEKSDTESLDALEKELTKDDDQEEEESVTVPADEMAKDEKPDEEKKDENRPAAEPAAAADSALHIVRALKPIVAGLPKESRKAASDALSKAMRDAMGKKQQTQDKDSVYEKLLKRKPTQDAKAQDNGAFGQNCLKQNPHYKGGK